MFKDDGCGANRYCIVAHAAEAYVSFLGSLGHGPLAYRIAHGVEEKIARCSHFAAEHNQARIQQIQQIGDAHAQITTGLFQHLATLSVSSVGRVDDGLNRF
jgi:hypothetical protein